MTPKLCSEPGCGELASGGGRCPAHAAEKRSDVARRRGPRKGMSPNWKGKRRAQLRRVPWCERCRFKRLATQVHHRVDREDGGTDSFENLESLCHVCHSEETAKRTPAGWNAFRRR